MGQVLQSMGWKPQELEAEPLTLLLELHDKDLPPLKTILLLLDGKDLKAVRQTCKSLNQYIKAEVWGSSSGRAQLTEKLLTRWTRDEATPVELIGVESPVMEMVCNERFVICALRSGVVSVHDIGTGDFVTNLRSPQQTASFQLAVKKDLVAFLSRVKGTGFDGTIWNGLEVVTHFSFVLPLGDCQLDTYDPE